MQTQYNHLSNEEFISRIESKSVYSPIIEELIQRLETLMKDNLAPSCGHNPHATCPVCESELQVNYDSDNLLFELKPKG